MDQSVEGAGRPRLALPPAPDAGDPTEPAAGEHVRRELRQRGAVEDVEVAELRVSTAVVDNDSIALLRGDLKQLGVEHIVGQAGPQGVRHDAEDERWYGMNLRVGADW